MLMAIPPPTPSNRNRKCRRPRGNGPLRPRPSITNSIMQTQEHRMIAFSTSSQLPRVSTGRQRSIRRRVRRFSLKEAVRFAVDVCFRFSGRAVQVKALWSETERVWLGSKTYLDWAMCLDSIDIPWSVATAAGAPTDSGQLREAVLEELNAYWTNCLTELPSRERPHWLPLP